jgi:hypothetical protein
MIQTTLNLHRSTEVKLDDASMKSGISRNDLVLQLLQWYMTSSRKRDSSFKRLKYQERSARDNWKVIHLSLNENQYEMLQDIRKFFRVSISLFLARAVEWFLNHIFSKNVNQKISIDNNPVSSYVTLCFKTANGNQCWQVIWGLPDSLPLPFT